METRQLEFAKSVPVVEREFLCLNTKIDILAANVV
jgi:hypothetical protein